MKDLEKLVELYYLIREFLNIRKLEGSDEKKFLLEEKIKEIEILFHKI